MIINKIMNCLTKFPKFRGGWSKDTRRAVKDEARRLSLPEGLSLAETLYLLRNNLKEIPRCKRCNKQLTFAKSVGKFLTYCSSHCSANSETTREKNRETVSTRYGVTNVRNINKDKRFRAQFKENFKKLEAFKDKIVPLFTDEDFRGGFSHNPYPFQCIRCSKKFESKFSNMKLKCPKCDRVYTDIEAIAKEILDNFKVDYQAHNRKILWREKRELDFYIPSHKLAIETHGLWFHTEKFFPRDYHKEKEEICRKKGITLIQIFSDEILHRKKAVVNELAHLLNPNQKTLQKQEIEIKQISHVEGNGFLEEFCPLEKDDSFIQFGAFFGDRLVSVMTMKEKGNTIIITRFCVDAEFKKDIFFNLFIETVVKRFLCKKIIVQHDRRWFGEQDFYLKSGFQRDLDIGPQQFFIQKSKRVSKKQLMNKLKTQRFSSKRIQNLDHITLFDGGLCQFTKSI